VTSVHNTTIDASSSIALEISYHKPVRASDFRWATTHYTTKNGHDAIHIKELIDEFNSLYRDVKRDDRYLLEYHSEGVSLSLNGDFLGSVGGGSLYEKELAQAIYRYVLGESSVDVVCFVHYPNAIVVSFSNMVTSIWFGKHPFFERLKRDLLTPLSI
jgi:hypothetical protein